MLINERDRSVLHLGRGAAAEERVRQGCREVLRNGRYRPTGRGKPASEYLMRAVMEESFPRINGPVDANNLVSLAHCVPVSLWDVELAGSSTFEFRLGRAGERYVFNATGQVLELEDLVCGCALDADGTSRPLVTPIKDSMHSKIQPGSKLLAGCIYYPLHAGSQEQLALVTGELLKWLLTCGALAAGQLQVCLPGQTVTL
jgi:DNA/RNA-binding domain of Phe-tRNA-synthetase-like protein